MRMKGHQELLRLRMKLKRLVEAAAVFGTLEQQKIQEMLAQEKKFWNHRRDIEDPSQKPVNVTVIKGHWSGRKEEV